MSFLVEISTRILFFLFFLSFFPSPVRYIAYRNGVCSGDNIPCPSWSHAPFGGVFHTSRGGLSVCPSRESFPKATSSASNRNSTTLGIHAFVYVFYKSIK